MAPLETPPRGPWDPPGLPSKRGGLEGRRHLSKVMGLSSEGEIEEAPPGKAEVLLATLRKNVENNSALFRSLAASPPRVMELDWFDEQQVEVWKNLFQPAARRVGL